MGFARLFVAVLVLAGATLAACSGNFGSGTTPPGIIPSGPLSGIAPSPSPTPNSVNGILTYGASDAFQPIPSVAGYGGAIAFPVPSPMPSNFSPIPVGVTVAVVAPTDAPDLNLATPGKKGKRRARPARALVYISLLPTRDITLESYPRIAVDVPRDIVTIYRESEIGLALFNPAAKDRTYRLAVAERDTATPPPTPSPPPTVPPSASASPSPSASAGPSAPGAPLTPPPLVATPPAPGNAVPGARGPPGVRPAAPTPSPTLPPQRIVFAGTAARLKMVANQRVVFAVYALPVAASPSPSPRASGAPAPSGSSSPSAVPSASGSPVAAPSAAASAASSAASSPSPTGT